MVRGLGPASGTDRMTIPLMSTTPASLVDAFTATLHAASVTGSGITFLHVPKCFGTAVADHARRLCPGLRLEGGHRALIEAVAPPARAPCVSSIREPFRRFKSLVLHGMRDNREAGFCSPDRFPRLSGFLNRPTAAGLRGYLAEEYWHASYFHWFRIFLGEAPFRLVRERAAGFEGGGHGAVDPGLLESWAEKVLTNLTLCLYDDPAFMNWLPACNAAGQHTRFWLRGKARRVSALIDEVIAEEPAVLRWERIFYERCVGLQRRRLESCTPAVPNRAA